MANGYAETNKIHDEKASNKAHRIADICISSDIRLLG